MPIRFRCDKCQTRIKVPDGSEGANVRCPSCNERQRVPTEPAQSVAARAESPAPAEEPVQEDPAAALAAMNVGDEQAEDESQVEEEQHGTPPEPAASDESVDTEEVDEESSDVDEQEDVDDEIEEEADEPDEESADPDEAEEESPHDEVIEEEPSPHPRPRPTPMPAGGRSRSGTSAGSTSGLAGRTGAAGRSSSAGSPRVIPLSSRPGQHRATARPIPAGESSTSGLPATSQSAVAPTQTRTRPTPALAASITVLGILTWVLRIWAVLLIGVVTNDMLELMVVPESEQASHNVSALKGMLTLIKQLTLPLVVWAVGELANAARHLLKRG